MATWSKAELEIAMGTTQDCSRAHELGKFALPTSLCRNFRDANISKYSAHSTSCVIADFLRLHC